MFTTFIQHIFFLPSCEYPLHSGQQFVVKPRITDVNVLMEYAMCNLCDDASGAGGENDTPKQLGGATKVQDKGENEETTAFLPTSEKPSGNPRDAAAKQYDKDLTMGTNILLAWLGTNVVLITVFTTSAFFPWISNDAGSARGNEAYLAFFFPL